MALEMWPVDRPIPYDKNPRTHSESQVAQLVRSIQEFGFTNPILVDRDGIIIAGHGRLLAAKKAGLRDVPVIVLGHLSDTQRRALVIADNKLALNAGWDDGMLAAELEALRADDFDMSLVGFSDDELSSILDGDDEGLIDGADEDAVPEPPPDPKTRPGDMYVLGRHRLLCGDSTNMLDVERLMAGAKPDLVLTDPPYGLGDTTSEKNEYDTYDDTRSNLIKTVDGFFPIAQTLAPTVVLTPGNGNVGLYPAPTWTMAWFTPAGVGRGPWGFCCWQPILCFGKDPKLSKGLGCHPDALVHTEAAEKLGHPCTKPIRFWEWLMERTSEKGELIYEPFGGSGTTFVAAEKLGRKCYGMELSPQYCDIIVARWEKVTGKTAEIERREDAA